MTQLTLLGVSLVMPWKQPLPLLPDLVAGIAKLQQYLVGKRCS